MNERASIAVAILTLAALAATATGAQPTTVQQDSTWSLARCQAAALAASPVLASGRADADAARATADMRAAGRLPVLGLSGRGSYTTETMQLDMPTPTGTRTIEFGDGTNTDLMLGVRAPLFEGGTLRAEHRAAEARWRASLADAAGDSLDLRLQVRQAFFAALGGEATADAARQGEARLRRHLDEVERNVAAGTATEEARLQVLSRLRATEQATVRAEAAAAARRYALGRLVGLAGMQVRPRADLETSLLAGDEAGRPWNERPRLQAVDARRDAADQSARAAAGSLLPAVDLEGGWHYGRPGIDQITDEWMDYGTVAVNLRWTLFDFGGRKDRVRSLEAQSRALTAARDDVRDALETRQANARTQLEAARTQAGQAADRLDLVQRRLTLARERWRQGHSTESELLDAQDDVTLAASDLATARAQLRLAEAELLAALGW